MKVHKKWILIIHLRTWVFTPFKFDDGIEKQYNLNTKYYYFLCFTIKHSPYIYDARNNFDL